MKLASVGREYSDLFGFVILEEEVSAQSNDKFCFMRVLMASSIFDLFLKVVVFQKEKICVQALFNENKSTAVEGSGLFLITEDNCDLHEIKCFITLMFSYSYTDGWFSNSE